MLRRRAKSLNSPCDAVSYPLDVGATSTTTIAHPTLPSSRLDIPHIFPSLSLLSLPRNYPRFPIRDNSDEEDILFTPPPIPFEHVSDDGDKVTEETVVKHRQSGVNRLLTSLRANAKTPSPAVASPLFVDGSVSGLSILTRLTEVTMSAFRAPSMEVS